MTEITIYNPEKIPGLTVEDYMTPLGNLRLGAIAGKLCLCLWDRQVEAGKAVGRLRRMTCGSNNARTDSEENSSVIERAKAFLNSYFVGARPDPDLPVSLFGTPFQQRVWEKLKTVGYGRTISYKDLAESLGCPAAVRAVASAVGANPLSVIIPCHRIIATDGSLTGYAGGLDIKQFLLDFEK